jgi:hypothetical protein
MRTTVGASANQSINQTRGGRSRGGGAIRRSPSTPAQRLGALPAQASSPATHFKPSQGAPVIGMHGCRSGPQNPSARTRGQLQQQVHNEVAAGHHVQIQRAERRGWGQLVPASHQTHTTTTGPAVDMSEPRCGMSTAQPTLRRAATPPLGMVFHTAALAGNRKVP